MGTTDTMTWLQHPLFEQDIVGRTCCMFFKCFILHGKANYVGRYLLAVFTGIEFDCNRVC
jgi:hypothetical protein